MKNLINVYNKAIEYIEEKIKNSEEIKNKELADYCGYEQHYCSKIFQKYAKMSIQEYVKRRKMTEAFFDMSEAFFGKKDSKQNIVDIAEKYLYSADGFTKAFKDVFGITPTQLKNENFEKILCNHLEPMYNEDYSEYIDEIKNYTIEDEEEMKFIGFYDNDLLPERNAFRDEVILSGNGKGKMIEICECGDYYENKYPMKFLGNYYSPFGTYPEFYKIIKIPKQKWVKFNEESSNKELTVKAIKLYFYNEWIKAHDEYELDNNYEIIFEYYNEKFLEEGHQLMRCEVWFPIRFKNRWIMPRKVLLVQHYFEIV